VRAAGDRVWVFVIPLAADPFARLKNRDLETVGEALFRCCQTGEPCTALVTVTNGPCCVGDFIELETLTSSNNGNLWRHFLN
jgi:hypothetical protein